MTSGIYKILNKLNKKVYIGSSLNIKNRWKNHLKLLVKNKHHSLYLQHAWNLYGSDNFEFIIIEEVTNKDDLIKREQTYLDRLKSYIPVNGYNVNPTAGSPLGVVRSDKTKKKLRSLVLGTKLSLLTRKKIGDSLRGRKKKPLSEAHKKSISAKLSGRKLSSSVRNRISVGHIGVNTWMREKSLSEETKIKISKSMKKLWKEKQHNAS